MKNTIIGIVIVLVLGIGIYYMVSNNNGSTKVPTNSSDTSNSPVSSNPQTNPFTSGGTSANLETTNPNPPVKTNPAPSMPSPTPVSENVTIDIKNFAFNPSVLNIKVGTKVTWTNNDSAPHTITSDSGGILNSATLSTGQSFSFTFTNAGSFSYHCAIHPMMKGSVVVN